MTYNFLNLSTKSNLSHPETERYCGLKNMESEGIDAHLG